LTKASTEKAEKEPQCLQADFNSYETHPIQRRQEMKRVLMPICMVLILWLSGCAQDDQGQKIEPTVTEGHVVEPTATESHVIEPTATAGYEIEQTINEGYGNYLLVPAGQFTMGDNYDEGNPREKPVRIVYLDAFYIGEFEVTNQEYKKFIDDEGYKNREYWSNGGFGRFGKPLHWNDEVYNGGGIPGNENFPVVGVSWFEAAAYCSWLSAQTGSVYRLPTEAEWEKAARGGDYLDGDDSRQVPNPIPQRRYPWGNEIDGSYANYLDSGDPYEEGLTPVGYYDGSVHGDFATHDNASPYGAYDMAGNVYEWINDYYRGNYDKKAVTNPQGPKRGSGHVIRGSAFLYETFKQRSAYRGSYYSSFRGVYIGIRCVRGITVSSLEDAEQK
jgi:formylglycine-generating enzyme required for sulfatase activity